MEQTALPDLDVSATAKLALDAVMAGNWWVLAAAVVLIIVWAMRTQLVKVWPSAEGFLTHPVVSVALPVLVSAAGGIITASAAGALSWAVVAPILLKALSIGATAVFAFVGNKKVAEAKEAGEAKAAALTSPAAVAAELAKPLEANTK